MSSDEYYKMEVLLDSKTFLGLLSLPRLISSKANEGEFLRLNRNYSSQEKHDNPKSSSKFYVYLSLGLAATAGLTLVLYLYFSPTLYNQ